MQIGNDPLRMLSRPTLVSLVYEASSRDGYRQRIRAKKDARRLAAITGWLGGG